MGREDRVARDKARRHERAKAAGRTPGKAGRPQKYWTEDDKREARKKDRKRYRERNREKVSAQIWNWMKRPENRPGHLARNRTWRARLLQSEGEHTAEDIEALFVRQKGKCVVCLKPFVKRVFDVDHHIPLSKGGTNDRSNLRLLHPRCNNRKHAKDPSEFAAEQGMLCY